MKRGAPSVVVAMALGVSAAPAVPRASPDIFAQSTPLCRILSDPAAYVGKRLLVQGYLTPTPEGRVFWDGDCRSLPVRPLPETQAARKLRQQFVRYADRSAARPPQVRVVYSGLLTDHAPALVCDSTCSRFTLEAAELVAVRAD